jgi:hypothetical protein
MGDPDLGIDPLTGTISSTAVERACEQLLGSMPLQSYAIVVRCGERGCYIAKNGGRSRRPSAVKRNRPKNHERGGLTLDMDIQSLFSGLLSPDGSFDRDAEQASVQIEPDISRWLPAYFEEKDKDCVVDPTGGGNGFLGGLAVRNQYLSFYFPFHLHPFLFHLAPTYSAQVNLATFPSPSSISLQKPPRLPFPQLVSNTKPNRSPSHEAIPSNQRPATVP